MADFTRTDRLSHQIRQEAYAIIHQLKDPRIPEMLSVTYAKVTSDLHYAKIGVSAIADEKQQAAMMKALKGASGFIRRELGARMDLRYIPELSFEFDKSIERSISIQKTLEQISRSENGGEDSQDV